MDCHTISRVLVEIVHREHDSMQQLERGWMMVGPPDIDDSVIKELVVIAVEATQIEDEVAVAVVSLEELSYLKDVVSPCAVHR